MCQEPVTDVIVFVLLAKCICLYCKMNLSKFKNGVGALPNVWVRVCQDLVTDVRGSGASCHVGRMPPRDGDKGDKGAPWTR